MSPGSEFVAVPADAAFRVFRRQADQTSSRWLLRCRLLASERKRLSPNREGPSIRKSAAETEPDPQARRGGVRAAYPRNSASLAGPILEHLMMREALSFASAITMKLPECVGRES